MKQQAVLNYPTFGVTNYKNIVIQIKTESNGKEEFKCYFSDGSSARATSLLSMKRQITKKLQEVNQEISN